MCIRNVSDGAEPHGRLAVTLGSEDAQQSRAAVQERILLILGPGATALNQTVSSGACIEMCRHETCEAAHTAMLSLTLTWMRDRTAASKGEAVMRCHAQLEAGRQCCHSQSSGKPHYGVQS